MARAGPGAGDVLLFFAFSHGWTWGFWALAGLWGGTVWDWPGAAFFYVGGTGVLLGGLVMTGMLYGRPGLEELGRRCVDPGRIPGRWWALILLLFPGLTIAASLAAVAAGASPMPLDLQGAGGRLQEPASFLAFVLFILIIGPLPEEIGWRGYLLDRLQVRWNALAASLVLALIWWSWHLPLFGLPGYFDAFGRAPPTPWDLLWGILPAAVVYTWVYNNTDRSVLAVILLHFMHNFTGEFLGMDDPVRPIRLGLEWGVAIGVVLVWGPATLRRGRPRDVPPRVRRRRSGPRSR
jgi:uncharacterized protein